MNSESFAIIPTVVILAPAALVAAVLLPEGKPGAPLARDRFLPEQDAAQLLVMLLKLWGYDVRDVNDGPAALVTARTYHPQVILLDIGLPGLNGYDVARQLRREAGPNRPLIVAMTGYGNAEDRRRSQEAGFDHHLLKPVDPGELERLLADRNGEHAAMTN